MAIDDRSISYIYFMKRFLKRILIGLGIVVILLESGLVLTGNAYVNKVLQLTILRGINEPDIYELDLFDYDTVTHDMPQPWVAATQYNRTQPNAEALSTMEKLRTTGFLVVHRDSLLFEKYWENANEETVSNSFSMAKSIVGILIGCALKDGLIQSVDQPVGDFIPSFKEASKDDITIRHLLTMSSGLDFKEDYVSVFSWPAEAYYGPDVNSLTLKGNAVLKPGTVWQYKGGDTQLLGMILNKVTGMSVSEYAALKLWKPIGAEQAAYWSKDDVGTVKVSCCYYATARDFAKIGRLYKQFGQWGERQIVDSAYVAAAITPAPLVDVHQKPVVKYGYQWWLMQYKKQDIIYMRGIRGQYVFVIPAMDLIVVRLGHLRGEKDSDDIPSDVYVYLDAAMQVAGQ